MSLSTARVGHMTMARAASILADTIDHHSWTKQALDAFESHSFTGRPGEMRWCSRCTLALPKDWKDPRKPVPLTCGDAKITPAPFMYNYTYDGPFVGLEQAKPEKEG